MSSGDLQFRSSMLEDVVGELERGGAGQPAEIARRLGRGWTEERVRAVLAELFSGGVVGHTPRPRVLVGRMTSPDQPGRTIDACRRAGLPVIEAKLVHVFAAWPVGRARRPGRPSHPVALRRRLPS